MDCRILDEEISRRIAKAQQAIADFQEKIAADTEHALVWSTEDVFMACARETQYVVAQNGLKINGLDYVAAWFTRELVQGSQRFEASSSLGQNVMYRCRVRALSEVLELLLEVQEEVEHAA